MKQRGRKSAAKLAVVSEIADTRPKPPADLTKSEKELFSSITASRSADFFDKATVPLLAEMCRLKTSVDLLAAKISETGMDWLDDADGVKAYSQLCRTRDTVQLRMMTLARTLRLTQQSRYMPDKKDLRTQTPVRKPWE